MSAVISMISDLSSISIYPAGPTVRTKFDTKFWRWLLQSFLEQHNTADQEKIVLH